MSQPYGPDQPPPQWGGQPGWPPPGQPTQQWPGQSQPYPAPQQPQQPPQQQYGQPTRYEQPQYEQPQYEQPRPEHRAEPRRRSKLLDPLALLAVLTLLVGLAAGFFVGRHSAQADTLDPKKVEAGVTTVLQTDYGVPNVSGMSCPHDMAVHKGQTYTCTFRAGAAKGSVDIIVQNDAGQYQVQGPRG